MLDAGMAHPVLPVEPVGIVQQGLCKDRLRLRERAFLFEIIGIANRHRVAVEQPRAVAALPFARSPENADIALVEVDLLAIVSIDDLDRNLRVIEEELGEPGYEPDCCNRWQCGNRQRRTSLALRQPAAGRPHDVKGFGQRTRQLLPFGCRHRLASQPVEQRETEPLLKLPDLMADSRLRDVQLLGGARETPRTGRRLETAERIERWQTRDGRSP